MIWHLFLGLQQELLLFSPFLHLIMRRKIKMSNVYTSFEQWKNDTWLETSIPRERMYSQHDLGLIEMGWKYGYDAAIAAFKEKNK